MSLQDLYQEIILDHAKHPRNAGTLDGATHVADGHNPLCGDQLRVYLRVGNGRVEDIRFDGKGCAISTAASSMMSELVKGKTPGEAAALLAAFLHVVKGEPADDADIAEDDRETLAVLGGVSQYPMRVKCATLPWRTMEAALAGGGTAKTE